MAHDFGSGRNYTIWCIAVNCGADICVRYSMNPNDFSSSIIIRLKKKSSSLVHNKSLYILILINSCSQLILK